MRLVMVVLVAAALAGACKKEEASAPASKPGPAAAPAAAAPAGGEAAKAPAGPRRVEVTVTKNGYTPDKVTVGKGEEVTLVFTRTENTECGAEVKIPALNVQKPLPLNEPVAIAFKRDEAGEVGFTCGMDMMKGTLVVQ